MHRSMEVNVGGVNGPALFRVGGQAVMFMHKEMAGSLFVDMA